MDDKAIRYDYFDWLCDKVRDRSCDKSYLMLLFGELTWIEFKD